MSIFKKNFSIIGVLAFAGLLSACGPSPEELAAGCQAEGVTEAEDIEKCKQNEFSMNQVIAEVKNYELCKATISDANAVWWSKCRNDNPDDVVKAWRKERVVLKFRTSVSTKVPQAISGVWRDDCSPNNLTPIVLEFSDGEVRDLTSNGIQRILNGKYSSDGRRVYFQGMNTSLSHGKEGKGIMYAIEVISDTEIEGGGTDISSMNWDSTIISQITRRHKKYFKCRDLR